MHWKSIEDIDIAQGIKADHTQAIKEEWSAQKEKAWKDEKKREKSLKRKKSSVLRSMIEKTCAENIWVRISK